MNFTATCPRCGGVTTPHASLKAANATLRRHMEGEHAKPAPKVAHPIGLAYRPRLR